MWKRFPITAVSASLMMVPLSLAAQTPVQQERERQEQQRVEERRDEAKVIRADRLIGQAVRDRQDERIGRIDDLALNVQKGKIAYAVISYGGLFGIGAEHVAKPWDQIQPDPARGVVRLDATRQDLETAEKFDPRTPWPAEVPAPGDRPVATTGPEAERHVLSMNRLIGMDVQNAQGERLGHIDDLAIKRDGALSYAVIARGGFLGFGHEFVAVPFDRFEIDARQERVMLNVTREQLDAARTFPEREPWPETVDWPFEGAAPR
jgi:sporulation protein YlmC with PRC-barrel domain